MHWRILAAVIGMAAAGHLFFGELIPSQAIAAPFVVTRTRAVPEKGAIRIHARDTRWNAFGRIDRVLAERTALDRSSNPNLTIDLVISFGAEGTRAKRKPGWSEVRIAPFGFEFEDQLGSPWDDQLVPGTQIDNGDQPYLSNRASRRPVDIVVELQRRSLRVLRDDSWRSKEISIPITLDLSQQLSSPHSLSGIMVSGIGSEGYKYLRPSAVKRASFTIVNYATGCDLVADVEIQYGAHIREERVPIVARTLVVPLLWYISARQEGGTSSRVMARDLGGHRRTLLFSSHESARTFARWMTMYKARLAGDPPILLEVGTGAIGSVYPQLRAKPLDSACEYFTGAP